MTTIEIVELAASFLSALLGGLLSLWVAKRVMFSRENIMETCDTVLEYAMNTKEGQEKLKTVLNYVANQTIGQGMKGFKGQMPKLKDAFGMILIGAAQRYGLIPSGSNQQQNQQEERNPLMQG